MQKLQEHLRRERRMPSSRTSSEHHLEEERISGLRNRPARQPPHRCNIRNGAIEVLHKSKTETDAAAAAAAALTWLRSSRKWTAAEVDFVRDIFPQLLRLALRLVAGLQFVQFVLKRSVHFCFSLSSIAATTKRSVDRRRVTALQT